MHLTIDGRKIFVTDRGSGPVVLLIHGHPSSCNDWKGVADRLESQARLGLNANMLGRWVQEEHSGDGQAFRGNVKLQ